MPQLPPLNFDQAEAAWSRVSCYADRLTAALGELKASHGGTRITRRMSPKSRARLLDSLRGARAALDDRINRLELW